MKWALKNYEENGSVFFDLYNTPGEAAGNSFRGDGGIPLTDEEAAEYTELQRAYDHAQAARDLFVNRIVSVRR